MVVILWVREQHVKLQLHSLQTFLAMYKFPASANKWTEKYFEIIYKMKDVSGLIHLIFQHGSKPMGEPIFRFKK